MTDNTVFNDLQIAGVWDGKVVLRCSKHPKFDGSGQPTQGCKDCWLLWFVLVLRKVPPERRAEKIEELLMVVRHMIEEVKAGRFDYQPLPHPVIHIEKDKQV